MDSLTVTSASRFRDAYERSVDDVLNYLIGYSQPSHMAYLGRRSGLSTSPPSSVMDHLSCFYPGMLALGIMYQVKPETEAMAANLTHTCYYMYESTSPTGIAPDSFRFSNDPQTTSDAADSPVSKQYAVKTK
jgi:mannosyl-oligosaccharide alpha-1,2-mannosidase